MSNRFGRSHAASLESYLSRWSGLHGGVAPTGLIGAWLRLTHLVLRPLIVLRVAPWAVTLLGLFLTVASLPTAPSAPLLAAALVVLGGLCDSLDGALAVARDRVSRTGAILDAVCDRLADLCLPAALGLAGGLVGLPLWACVGAAVVGFLHEYLRALTASLGVGSITVSERPTRIIVAAAFLVATGAHPFGTASGWAGAGSLVLLLAGAIGFAQLTVSVARRLS